MMVNFPGIQKRFPEYWIMRTGPTTVRRMMRYYNLRDEATARSMLDNLVKAKKLIEIEVEGAPMWDVARTKI